MQVTETLIEGLKRELKVIIPAADMEKQMNERLAEAKDKVRLNGFRPGKVPMSHMKKAYGKSVMAELVNEIIQQRPSEILAGRNEKSATQPEITMTENEEEAADILAARKDFEFGIVYEVIPEFDIADLSKLSVTRQIVKARESDVEEQVNHIAETARTFKTKDGAAENGDQLLIDYAGKIDGEAFDGGTQEDARLVIGSNRFIPGFEEQLIGVNTDDETNLTVKFPDDYPEASLAGKQAEFDVKVKEVASPDELEINDEFAKNMGVETIEKLRQSVRDEIEGQYAYMARQKTKRQILDQMNELHTFETPPGLVDSEFENIWRQVTTDLEENNRTFADEDTTEEEAREEYKILAERRVRLGLVIAKIGEKADIEVTEEELRQALFEQVRKFPGQEEEIYKFFQETPSALHSLRAPIFEDKTIDHIMTLIEVKDETVTREQLIAEEPEENEEPEKVKKSEKTKDSETGKDSG